MRPSGRYFVILGAMRTGSNLLEKTFEQLGDTVCYGEVFNPGFISGPRKKDVLGYTVKQRDADPIGFLEQLIAVEPDKITGLRLFAGHSRKVLEYVLRDPRCIRIILTRDPLDSFISLKIARKTDQWMLRNPRRRMETRIDFDLMEFERYRTKQSDHYAWIEGKLKRFGMHAHRVDYADLGDHAVLQRLAEQIGSTGTVPSARPILKQNPTSRAAKVQNYAEMCAALDLPPEQDTDHVSNLTDIFVPRPVCPDGFPVAYAPVFGTAFEPMISLLHRIEVRDFGRPRILAPDLIDRAHRSALYTSPLPSEVQAISMVSHPFQRLHAAFLREMFGPGWNFSSLRKALVRTHGPMPAPRGLQRRPEAYTPEQRQIHFAGFLDMVEAALRHDPGTSLQAEWRPQVDILGDHLKTTRIVRIFRQERFEEAIEWITGKMSLPGFPPGQIKGIAQTGRQKLIPIDDFVTPDLTAKVMHLHAQDFEAFEYPQMPELPKE